MPPVSEILVLFSILIVSLSVHEASHAVTADRLGDPTARMLGRLTLNPIAHIDPIGTVVFPLVAMTTGVPILGWAKPVPVNPRNLRHPRRDFAIVAAAGPASNFVMAAVAAGVIRLAGSSLPYGVMSVRSILVEFVILNVSLGVFNLIPVPPLDGGNILAGFVPEPVARLIDLMRPWGFLVLYALLFLHVLEKIQPVSTAILRFLLL